ncbi:MAG: response regulator transcription factor [Acidobacteria bacterium]|nr:response regulator transcription factor [Acidobacteriota bacterium]
MTAKGRNKSQALSEDGTTIRTLVADANAILRRGLRELLRDSADIEVVGEAGDAREAVEGAQRLVPDVVLMAVDLPGLDSAQTTAAILAQRPQVRVLTVSGTGSEANVVTALRAGALGFVSNTSPKEEILEAVRRAHRGQTTIPHVIALKLLNGDRPADLALAPLTRREVEILRLLARGLSNHEIADRAHVTPGTVRTHVTNIFNKLGVSNRVEATLCALRDGLATLEECLEQIPPAGGETAISSIAYDERRIEAYDFQ